MGNHKAYSNWSRFAIGRSRVVVALHTVYVEAKRAVIVIIANSLNQQPGALHSRVLQAEQERSRRRRDDEHLRR